jgi:hypothetical protein
VTGTWTYTIKGGARYDSNGTQTSTIPPATLQGPGPVFDGCFLIWKNNAPFGLIDYSLDYTGIGGDGPRHVDANYGWCPKSAGCADRVPPGAFLSVSANGYSFFLAGTAAGNEDTTSQFVEAGVG